MLRRRGLPLALAELELDDRAELVDLDDPVVLGRERLRPSRVATRDRSTTQPQARLLHGRHRKAAGLKWWSIYEARWINVTVFDRAASQLRSTSVRPLTVDDPAVVEAADFFGLRTIRRETPHLRVLGSRSRMRIRRPTASEAVLGLLCLMYLITYVDRVNIATAAERNQARALALEHAARVRAVGVRLSVPAVSDLRRLGRRSVRAAADAVPVRADLGRRDDSHRLGRQPDDAVSRAG